MAIYEVNLSGWKELQAKLAKAGQKGRVLVAKVFRRRLEEAATYGKREHLSGPTTGPNRLRARTGHLRASFHAIIKTTAAEVTGRLGFIHPAGGGEADPLRYAWTHHAGAIIVPKKARFLAIPTPFAQTKTGVTRGKPRDFPNTFVARGIIWQGIRAKRVKGAKLSAVAAPLFLLRTRAVIPARPILPLVMNKYLPRIVEDLKRDLGQVVNQG